MKFYLVLFCSCLIWCHVHFEMLIAFVSRFFKRKTMFGQKLQMMNISVRFNYNETLV